MDNLANLTFWQALIHHIVIAILILALIAVFAGWYLDPKARKAAENTINEMLSSETDESVNREWW